MAKELRCGDMMPGCKFVATAETEEELLKKVTKHAKEAHNIKEITPELSKKVKGAIRTVAKVK